MKLGGKVTCNLSRRVVCDSCVQHLDGVVVQFRRKGRFKPLFDLCNCKWQGGPTKGVCGQHRSAKRWSRIDFQLAHVPEGKVLRLPVLRVLDGVSEKDRIIDRGGRRFQLKGKKSNLVRASLHTMRSLRFPDNFRGFSWVAFSRWRPGHFLMSSLSQTIAWPWNSSSLLSLRVGLAMPPLAPKVGKFCTEPLKN